MKVEKTLTSKALIYYSLTGNTKGIINKINISDYDVYNLNENENINLDQYETILIGTSTWGDGIPPKPLLNMKEQLFKISNKKIGLFGSGNSHYQYYCGALDLLEELFKTRNKIIFKYKFEGYPTERAINEFKKILEETEV
jgi:flavodoxin I